MSAFIVSKAHIDAMVQAGLSYGMPHRHNGPLCWHIEQPEGEDYERGEPWGPTAVENIKRRRRELTRETANQVGAMLWAENRLSVDHRYDENEIEPGPYVFRHSASVVTSPVAILKAINCYEYQSCEHPEWETSEAHAFCEALTGAMVQSLPGYEAAEWEISESGGQP